MAPTFQEPQLGFITTIETLSPEPSTINNKVQISKGTMSYHVGIDLGTTYTAAATYKENRAEIFSLGQDKSAIPSLVLLKESGEFLTGDAAARKAISTPENLAREFKRRLGDSTPIVLGDTSLSAEKLTAELLKNVVTQIEKQEGSAPDRITITHPANWGDFKRKLLLEVAEMASIDASKVTLLSEPEAAAIYYACNEKLAVGDKIAVYDLGGGTFDTAILERTEKSFTILGKPEGIERLGGVDFDSAVFNHVTQLLGDELAELDYEDPASIKAVARLKQDCLDAKEALSSDTDAVVPVLLPGLQTEIRITRREFENLCKPALDSTLEGLRRALASAQIEPQDLAKVLLVGGSSKIPVIAQLITAEFGTPIAVDSHPKHSIALGAALYAGKATLLSAPPAVNQETAPQSVAVKENTEEKVKEPGSQPIVPLSASLSGAPTSPPPSKKKKPATPPSKTATEISKIKDIKKNQPAKKAPATKVYEPVLAATKVQPATSYAPSKNTIQNADFKQVKEHKKSEPSQKSRVGLLIPLAGIVLLIGIFVILNRDTIFPSSSSSSSTTSSNQPASPATNQELGTTSPDDEVPNTATPTTGNQPLNSQNLETSSTFSIEATSTTDLGTETSADTTTTTTPETETSADTTTTTTPETETSADTTTTTTPKTETTFGTTIPTITFEFQEID